MFSPRTAIRGTAGLTLDELEDLYGRISRFRDDLAGVLGTTLEEAPLGWELDRTLAELYQVLLVRRPAGAHL